MDNNKILFAVGLLLFALGLGIGRYTVTTPDSQQKNQETTKEIKNIEETVTETKKPDGTIIKETKKIDKSVIVEKKKNETITDAKTQYRVSAMAGYNFDKVAPVYGALVEKRILGNLSAGVWANTDKVVGASLSLEF